MYDGQGQQEQGGEGAGHQGAGGRADEQACERAREDDGPQAGMRIGRLGPQQLAQRTPGRAQVGLVPSPRRLLIGHAALRPLVRSHPAITPTGRPPPGGGP
ncbi:hypothetical protein ACWDDN_09330 [Streptomyces griseoruber]